MSATVDAEKIAGYFGGCPALHVPGRTFPVDVRYLEDALEVTRWWISESSPYASEGLRNLPGRTLSHRTPFSGSGMFRRGKNRPEWTEDNAAAEDDDREDAIVQDIKLEKRYSAKTASTINLLDERQIPYDLILRLLECVCFEDDPLRQHSTAILIFMPGIGEIRRMIDILTEHKRFGSEHEFIIHALHSAVSSENQGAVFDIPRGGVRKIVIGMGSPSKPLFNMLIFSESDEHCGNGNHHPGYYLCYRFGKTSRDEVRREATNEPLD